MVPVILIAAAFGPYVSMALGLRLEHMLIYPLAIYSLFAILNERRKCLIPPATGAIFMLLVFNTLWALAVTVLGENYNAHGADNSLFYILAGLEAYCLPIAILLVMVAFFQPASSRDAKADFGMVLNVFLSLLCVNTVVSLIMNYIENSWYFRMIDSMDVFGSVHFFTDFMQKYYWRGPGVLMSGTMGRFSGIFSQVAETGLAYSLGLLVWAYKYRIRGGITFTGWIILSFLVIGGMLTASKVFMIGGIFLFVIYGVDLKIIRAVYSFRGALTIAVVGSLTMAVLSQWEGQWLFFRLIQWIYEAESFMWLIDVVSGGRYGVQNVVSSLNPYVLEYRPLYGCGFSATPVVDSGYFQYFAQGGAIGLVAYVATLVIVGWRGIKYFLIYFKFQTEEQRLLMFIFLFAVGAGFGTPVVTINRFSTVFWVIIFMLIWINENSARMVGASNKTMPVFWDSGETVAVRP